MANLLNSFKGLLTDNVIGKISSLIGSNSSLTKTALGSLAPSLMKGIINKGSSESGAQSLLDMMKNDNVSANKFGNLSSLLDNDSSDLLSAGSSMNDSLFGNNAQSMTSGLGMGSESSSKLMNIATPLLMGSLGGIVKKDNLDAKGLSSYLTSQKGHLVETASKAASTATSTASRTTAAATEAKSGGGGFLKWLIPLFLLLAAAWFAMQQFGNKDNAETAAVETTETQTTEVKTQPVKTAVTTTTDDANATSTTSNTASTTTSETSAEESDDAGSGNMNYTVDDLGNLVDADGKIILKKGEFTIKDGAYYNAEGKKIGVFKAIGKAIGGAATKTADAFKDVFGGMFKKKTSGEAVAAYSLTNIEFDEAHKVVNFSKNEVLGLASALKAYPDSKIKVQVAGGDKKTSKMRATVVHDWLVTLGISDKQVSAEGLGEGADKVSIIIE